MSELRVLEPASIFAELNAQPPLMRPQAIEKYLGAEIDWRVRLLDARERRPDEIHVVFYGDPKGNEIVTGDVPLSKYPQLRLMRVGDPAQVHGKIRHIDTMRIELDISEMQLVSVSDACQNRKVTDTVRNQ